MSDCFFKFAVDLTWVRHKIVGGAENYIVNLLSGFKKSKTDFNVLLLVAKDNYVIFEFLKNDARFVFDILSIESSKVLKRVFWQNFKIQGHLRRKGYNVCFTCGSFFSLFDKRTRYVSVIHDLQSIHYPKYHSFLRRIWNKINWKNAVKTSKKLVAISDYVKNDVCSIFHTNKEILTIYNPILYPNKNSVDLSIISKLNLNKRKFFFTISKLNAHKNLQILIKVFAYLKTFPNKKIPDLLVISGIGGAATKELNQLIDDYNLNDNVLLTGYVSENEKNALYSSCFAFLFPSVFEGFGMPLIEAMYFDAPVITTKCACIPEITQGKANYIEDPYSVREWVSKMEDFSNHSNLLNFLSYDIGNISKKYLDVIKSVFDTEKE